MATTGRAVITIEPDLAYTTQVFSQNEGEPEMPLTEPAVNQTLTNAFNKGRDDLAALATGNLKHRRIVITTVVF